MKHETLPFFAGNVRLSNAATRFPIAAIKSRVGVVPGRRDNGPALSAGGARQRRRGRRPQF